MHAMEHVLLPSLHICVLYLLTHLYTYLLAYLLLDSYILIFLVTLSHC